VPARRARRRGQALQRAQIEHLIADGDAAAEVLALRARRKAQNGRFWIGKSLAGAFAELTQLLSFGSCVALIAIMDMEVKSAAAQGPRRPRGAGVAKSGAKFFFRPRHTCT